LCVLFVIVKRKYIRSPLNVICLAVELPVCECCVTAAFSDIFEANGLSIDDIVRCKSYKPLPSGGRR
jgi:hypothetical protein